MSKYDQFILNLMQQNNGYLHIRQLEKYGIERTYIYPTIKRMKLKKVARGVYCADSMKPDYMYLTCVRNKETILSHESAAFLHGLLSVAPEYVSVTVAHSYNTRHLEDKWVKCYQIDREWLDIGKEKLVDCYGNPVCTYDAERTICDFIREKDYKRQDGNVLLQKGIETYFDPEYGKDIEKLLSYAKRFRIVEQVQEYVSHEPRTTTSGRGLSETNVSR